MVLAGSGDKKVIPVEVSGHQGALLSSPAEDPRISGDIEEHLLDSIMIGYCAESLLFCRFRIVGFL